MIIYGMCFNLQVLLSYLYKSEFLYSSVKLILRASSCASEVTSNIQVAGL